MANCSLVFGAYGPHYYVTLRHVTLCNISRFKRPSVYTSVLSRVFEGQKLLPSPEKRKNIYIYILLSLQYISIYIGKIIQTRRGQCTHWTIFQNCIKMHQIASQRIFISKHFRGGMPPDPPWKLLAFSHSGLFPQTINPRQNPVHVFEMSCKSTRLLLPVFPLASPLAWPLTYPFVSDEPNILGSSGGCCSCA